jgi:hypothetical protein
MEQLVLTRHFVDGFALSGRLDGGELYLRPEVAAGFVIGCSESGTAVIGVEAFELHRGSVRPRMDLIFDASESDASDWEAFASHVNVEALRFLSAVPAGLLVSLVTLPRTARSDVPVAPARPTLPSS